MNNQPVCSHSDILGQMDQSLWQTSGSFLFLIYTTLVNLSNIVIWDLPYIDAVWDFSKTPTLLDFKSTSGGILWIFCSHTFVL